MILDLEAGRIMREGQLGRVELILKGVSRLRSQIGMD